MIFGGTMVPLPPMVAVTVALAPVENALMSLAALWKPDDYGGVDDWVLSTAAHLPNELRTRHTFWMKWLWLDSLTNAVDQMSALDTFPAYLDALANQDATALRDRLLYWMIHSVHLRLYSGTPVPSGATPVDPTQLLGDVDFFQQWFVARLNEKLLATDIADLTAFHALLNRPQQLQTELVAHLHTMWAGYLAAEWTRVAPRLQRCVDAFQQLDLQNGTMLDAMQLVTGRDLRPVFHLDMLFTYHRVRFIPTIHNGPYIVWFGNQHELTIGFPAHEPPTRLDGGLRFDQSTLVNRFKALADETRLAMLWALRDTGELSTQAIIDRFGLDKSAASRHLRQLVATSLIEERREEGAKKVYRLNSHAIDAVTRLLNGLR